MNDKFIVIRWPSLETEVKAKLLTGLNPSACKAFIKTLPNKSIQSHAVVAGHQMYCPYRLIIDESECAYESMERQPIGRINIDLDFQYLSVNYGEVTEAVPALAIAQVIEEDIDKLSVLGEKVWNNLLFSNDYILVQFEYLGGEKNE